MAPSGVQASAYFREDGSYCCPLIHGFHIHVHLQKQIDTKFKKKRARLPLFLPLVSYGETDELLFAGFAVF